MNRDEKGDYDARVLRASGRERGCDRDARACTRDGVGQGVPESHIGGRERLIRVA